MIFLLLLAVSMRVVYSPNGTQPFDMGDFRVQKYHAHSSLLTVKSHLCRMKHTYALSSPAHFRALRDKIIPF